MINSNQLRVARFALRWSVQELSDKAGVSVRTIKRIESNDSVPQSSAVTIQTLRDCLEAAGIEFIGTPGNRPGIRIGPPTD